jgi:hypothetical protein
MEVRLINNKYYNLEISEDSISFVRRCDNKLVKRFSRRFEKEVNDFIDRMEDRLEFLLANNMIKEIYE